MDTGGAVPIKNEKGEMTMKKVKVHRYVAGKRPKYAPKSDDEDYEEEDNEVDNQQSTIQYVPTNRSTKIDDRRLRRLQERANNNDMVYEEKERIARHRQVMDPQVLVDDEEIDDRMELDEESEKSEYDEPQNNVEEDDEDIDDEERIRHRQILKQKVFEKQEEELLKVEEEQKQIESGESESEEESEYEEEETTDSEEAIAPRLKPVFVRMRDRVTMQEKELEARKLKDIEQEKQRLHEETKKQTKKMIEDEIKKERTAEKEAEENIICDFDTDDENDENEYESWKLRELKRIKRDRDEREAREREKQEVLRLRNMTEEERKAELRQNPKKITNLRQKGKYKFLQKYYHRGVFFMHEEEDLYKRNYAEPTLEDHFDKTRLPKVMQVKNFGMSGRTKYTHLVDQDTSKLDDNPWNTADKFAAERGAGMKQIFDRPGAKKRK